MGARLSRVLLLVAWLLATGSHWDLLQLVAWSRMLVDNAAAMPLSSAVERTFSPAGMCELCHVVQDAKQDARDDAPAGAFVSKAPLVFQRLAAVTIAAPPSEWFPPVDQTVTSLDRAAPPPPPPRAGGMTGIDD